MSANRHTSGLNTGPLNTVRNAANFRLPPSVDTSRDILNTTDHNTGQFLTSTSAAQSVWSVLPDGKFDTTGFAMPALPASVNQPAAFDVATPYNSNYYALCNYSQQQYMQQYQQYMRNPASVGAFYAGAGNSTAAYYGGYANGLDYNTYSQFYRNGYPYNGTGSTAIGSSPLQPYANGSLGNDLNGLASGSLSLPASSDKPRRAKKRKAPGGPTSPEPNYTRVFVWELEELYPMHNDYCYQSVTQILISGFAVDHSDDCDQTNVDDANVEDALQELCMSVQGSAGNGAMNGSCQPPSPKMMATSLNGVGTTDPNAAAANRGVMDGLRRLTDRYQRMKDKYNEYKDSMQSDNKSMVDDATCAAYKRCLKIIGERCDRSVTDQSFANVVISGQGLAISLAKLLATGASTWVPVENVYSSTKIGKESALERISSRFKKERLVIISGSAETAALAKREGIPVFPIRKPEDVNVFYYALDKILL